MLLFSKSYSEEINILTNDFIFKCYTLKLFIKKFWKIYYGYHKNI